MKIHDFYNILKDFDKEDKKKYYNKTPQARLNEFSIYIAERQRFYKTIQNAITANLTVFDDKSAVDNDYLQSMGNTLKYYFKLVDQMQGGEMNGSC